VMCMTGDTNVLMADGTTQQLKDIKVGDHVATFDNGKLSKSKVNNWRSSGIDSIYKIQTQSGIMLRANKRHPFLVMNEGVLEWTRLNQLRVGDLLVSLKGAADHQGQKQSLENVRHAKPVTATTEKTQTPHVNPLEVMGCGLEKIASAENQSAQKDFVAIATEKNTCRQQLQKKTEQDVSNTDTALLLNNTKSWLLNATTSVMCAVRNLLQKTQKRIGMQSYASTIATTRESSEDCSVTTATLPSVMERRQAYLNELHRISDFTVDQIVSITPDGKEEVFDVEIDKTENFIANGVVSHNTRWAERDLTGRIIKDAAMRDKGEEWEVIEFPAIMPSGNPLWPEFWSLNELTALKEELPPAKWNAQYQQAPTGEEGALVKREWWKLWNSDTPPPCEFIIQSWDTAFTKGERSDYSACTTWGIFYPDENRNNASLILLDAMQKRMEFPELKEAAFRMYKNWEPDACIVEAKAAGAPLIYELRSMGIPVSEYSPSRGNDKFVRLNSVTDLFSSGKVWAPDTGWARDVIEQMAAFPNAAHDDLVDSTTQALIRFRQGGFIRLNSDEEDEPRYFKRTAPYY